MMKYNEILNAITEIRRDINGMKTALDTEIDSYYKQFDGMTLKEKIEAKKSNKELEEKKAFEEKDRLEHPEKYIEVVEEKETSKVKKFVDSSLTKIKGVFKKNEK